MRLIAVCIFILICLFAGHCAYDRITADRKLNQALHLLPLSPVEAYRTIKEVLDYSHFVSLGKVGEVERKFLDAVQRDYEGGLGSPQPMAEIFPATEQAIGMLNDFTRQTGTSTTGVRNALLKAAYNSIPALKEKGTLKAWDNMVSMFQTLSGSPANPGAVLENFNKWFEEIKTVPRRPFGLRDALNEATDSFGKALDALKLSVGTDKDHPLAAAPPALTDNQAINAMKLFAQAGGALDNFQSLFGETKIPAELRGIHAKIDFNLGAVKLAHFQDHKNTIALTGSDFLVEFLVRSDTSEVPSAGEMASTMHQAAKGNFQGAQESFPLAESIDEPMRRALAAAAIWAEGMMDDYQSGQVSFEKRSRTMRMANGLTGAAAEVVKTIQSTPRAMFIVQAP